MSKQFRDVCFPVKLIMIKNYFYVTDVKLQFIINPLKQTAQLKILYFHHVTQHMNTYWTVPTFLSTTISLVSCH